MPIWRRRTLMRRPAASMRWKPAGGSVWTRQARYVRAWLPTPTRPTSIDSSPRCRTWPDRPAACPGRRLLRKRAQQRAGPRGVCGAIAAGMEDSGGHIAVEPRQFVFGEERAATADAHGRVDHVPGGLGGVNFHGRQPRKPESAVVDGLRSADRFNILGDRLDMHQDLVQFHRGNGDLAADLGIMRVWRAAGGQRGARSNGLDG